MGGVSFPEIVVNLNGALLAEDVAEVSVRLGLNAQIAEATVIIVPPVEPAEGFYDPDQDFGTTVGLPTGTVVTPYDTIDISLAVGGRVGAISRFQGYYLSYQRDLNPLKLSLFCRGKLILAERYEPGTAIDMSLDGDGQTDQALVTAALVAAGFSLATLEIGGTGKTLGTYAKDAGLTWDGNESALDFIKRIDAVSLGYHTYDTFDGTVKRTQIIKRPAAVATKTFTEGVDILSASTRVDITPVSNRVTVTGYPGPLNNAPITVTVQDSNPLLVRGEQWYQASSFASQLIELAQASSGWTNLGEWYVAPGISCQEVADWLLQEKNCGRETLTLTTTAEAEILPGDTIEVVAPVRLGIDRRRYWVDSVLCNVSKAGFTQTLTGMAVVPFAFITAGDVYLLTEDLKILETE